jgi:hypothetical protein
VPKLTVIAQGSEHTSPRLGILVLLLMSRRVTVVGRPLRWRGIHVVTVWVSHGCGARAACRYTRRGAQDITVDGVWRSKQVTNASDGSWGLRRLRGRDGVVERVLVHGRRRKLEATQLSRVRPPLRKARRGTHWVRPRMHGSRMSHSSSHVGGCVAVGS